MFFRCADEAGNYSGVVGHTVGNIDRTAPVIELTADNTSPLRTGTLAASTEDGVDIFYSTNKSSWSKYKTPLNVTKNCTFYFKATDAAGNVGTAEIVFENIDRTAPVIELVGDTTTPLQSGTITATTDDGSEIFYTTDNANWIRYEAPLEVTENGLYCFKATDVAGNTGTNFLVFENIDSTAPVIELVGDTTTPLQSGTITATTDDGSEIFYTTDGANWIRYEALLEVTGNAAYCFRATDAAGNVGTAEIVFENIDRTAPVIELVGDNATPLQSGTLTAATDDGSEIFYTTDNVNWIRYEAPLEVTGNAAYCFRATDAAGNVGTAEIVFENIDRTAPVTPTVFADITDPTNTDVVVTAVFSEDASVREYSLDGTTWTAYTAPIVFAENGGVLFRAADAAGNVSETASYEVSNIDKAAPDMPVVTADITSLTNDDVCVSAAFSEDSVVKEYSIDGETWLAYAAAILFTENGTVFFRGTDAAGNRSGEAMYTVDYIVVPDNTVDSGWNDALWTKNAGWNNRTAEFYSNTISGTGEIFLDEKCSVNLRGWHNIFGNDGTNVDTGDVAQVEVDTAAKLTFTVDSDAAGTFYIYEDGFDKKGNRKLITVGKVLVKAGKTAELKDVCLAADGRYYAAMTAKNVRKAGTEGYYNVKVKDITFFADADDGTNNEADKDIAVEVGRGTTSIVLDSEPMTASTKFGNFVGFGDAADYAKLDLVSSAYMSFSVKADGKSKFTIWKQDAKGKLSKVSTTSLTAKNGFAATTAAKFLDTSKYTYYVSMESTDAKKGGSVYYDVEVGGKSVFFDSADNGLNNVLYDKKAKAFRSDANFLANEVGAGSQGIRLDDGVEADGWQNFVGYGDAADYAKITLTDAGNLSFTLESTGDATFTVYRKGVKKGKEVLETIQTTKLTLAKGASIAETTTKLLTGLDAGEYYISMAAKSTKATDKGSVFYNVTANLDVPVSSELSMPETDVPASASVDARLCSASDKLPGESGCGLLASL